MKPLLAILVLGAIWIAVQSDAHNAIGRAVMAPLAAQ